MCVCGSGVSLEELALGCAGVSHDADVDVSSEGGALHGGLGHAAEQHEQNATLHLVITWEIIPECRVSVLLRDRNSEPVMF